MTPGERMCDARRPVRGSGGRHHERDAGNRANDHERPAVTEDSDAPEPTGGGRLASGHRASARTGGAAIPQERGEVIPGAVSR